MPTTASPAARVIVVPSAALAKEAGVLYVSVAVMRVGWYEGDAEDEGEDVEDARGDG